MRRFLAFIVIGLLVLLGAPNTPAATAGAGASQECTNGVTYGGGQEVPIIQTPITLNLEGGLGVMYVILCYSTTPNGSTAPALIGGSVWFAGNNQNLICRQDANTATGVGCFVGWRNEIVVAVEPRVQSTSALVGVAFDRPTALTCVYDVRVYTPTGVLGPYDVGVCP